MRRTTPLLAYVGVFLVVSVLWPYEPEEVPDDPTAQTYWHRSPPAAKPSRDMAFLEMRDEWGDVTNVTIFEGGFTLDARQLLLGSLPQELVLDPGVRVLPGTRRIVATVWLEDTAASGLINLNMVAANDARKDIKNLRHGIPKSFDKVDESMNDWSPDPDTRWRFSLATTSSSPVKGTIRINILRDDEPLPTVVEYRERWRGQDRVMVLDQRGALRDVSVGVPYTQSQNQPQSAPRIHMLPPIGVQDLIVRLDYNSTTPTGLHYHPLLSYHGADKGEKEWERSALRPTEERYQSNNGTFMWRLPMEPRMWDSPFAEITRTAIRINWYGEGSTAVLMEGDFHFYIVARRDAST